MYIIRKKGNNMNMNVKTKSENTKSENTKSLAEIEAEIETNKLIKELWGKVLREKYCSGRRS
jgi:hypothetical protein